MVVDAPGRRSRTALAMPAGDDAAVPRSRRHRPVAATLLGMLAAAVSFVGSWVPSYWGDEAASVMSATRSWSSLAAELTTIDGVHGVYYALLHLWVGVFGTSELSTRAPSSIAVGLVAAGVVLLVRMHGGARLAILAGAACLLLPRVTGMGIEARSYALGAAVAVWVTVLLVRLVRDGARRRWWLVYGAAVAAGVFLFLYLGLLLLVHAVYVAVCHRRMLRPWASGAVAALLLAAPMAAVGYAQRNQIHFLARRHYATPDNVLVKQWFGSAPLAVAAWAIILIAVAGLVLLAVRRGRSSEGDRAQLALGVLATAWLVLPTSVLLVGDAAVSPMYNVRYLSWSAPAAAILLAIGIGVVLRLLRSWPIRLAAGVLVLAVLAGLAAPVYLRQRTAFAKDGGSDWRQVSQYVGAHAQAGDAIVFDQATKPSQDPRLAARLYSAGFRGLDDVALVTPFDRTDGLWDRVATLAETGQAALAHHDVWAVELTGASAAPLPADIIALRSRGYRVESSELIHRTTVYHLTREQP